MGYATRSDQAHKRNGTRRGRAEARKTWLWRAVAVLVAAEMAFGSFPLPARSVVLAEEDAAAEAEVVAEEILAELEAAEPEDEVSGGEVAEPESASVAEGVVDDVVATESVEAVIADDAAYFQGALSAESENYEVTVEAGKDARLPEDVYLTVEEFDGWTEEYREAFVEVYGVEPESNEAEGLGMDAIDITLHAGNGDEIEPSAEASVSINRKSLPEGVTSEDELAVQHLDESGEKLEVVDLTADGSAEVVVEDEQLYVEFATEVFSTFTVTWRDGRRTVTVHYVDESGVELDVSNSGVGVFGNLDDNSSSPAFLIYDIDGYEYSYTYRNSNTNNNRIAPLLTKNNSNRWRYMGANSTDTTELSNGDNIYVVYKKKADITQGGEPTLKPVGEDDYPDDPSILKEIDSKSDGTADLSLSITGHTTDREVEKLADVIVVFDVSGSMGNPMSGSTRLATAKTAVNNLVDSLATKKNSDEKPLVRMALISFSTTATKVRGLTDLTDQGVTDYKESVNGLSADGGTNWDYALQLANQMEVDSGRATFVIFVTDGDPTFRNTRGDVTNSNLDMWTGTTYTYYRNQNVFGQGSGDSQSRNYNAAVTQGQAIVAANKNLYTIGISNDVTKVANFNTAAGGNGAYIAADAAALNQAFADIEAAIVAKLGFSEIEMTDGITEMTQTVDKSGMTSTDGSFTYWKKEKDSDTFVEWDPASEGCEEAEYDVATGTVKWNMGSNFMPEDGATYKVTWKVWPSQDAYDILAKCQNDPTYYDTLTDVQKAQILRTGTAPNYTYTLLTNEPDAGITYKSATKSGSGIQTEGETKTIPFNTVDPIGMSSDTISVKKIWDNDLDGRSAGTDPIEFTVTADGETFGTIELGPGNSWEESGFNISSGLMTTSGSAQTIYEKGHDFTIVEPEDLAYYWDFKADVYRVMVINGKTTMLVKVDSAADADYTIDGGYYKVSSSGAVLTATNERRSYLNLSKTVVDASGNTITPDQAFTMTVTVVESKGEEVWFSAYDSTAGATVKDSTIASGTGVVYQESDGYFHCPSGTQLTLTIKGGWNYRFINLHTGSTYSITETEPGDGYVFLSASATAAGNGTAGKVTDQTAAGTIDASNTNYTVTYINKKNSVDLTLKKVVTGTMADTTKKFTFTVKNGDGTSLLPNGAATTQLGNGEEIKLEGLAAGQTITITETDGDGYTKTYETVVGESKNSGAGKEVTLTDLNADATVTFTNTLDSVPVTLVKQAVSSPVARILVCAGLAAAAAYVAVTRSLRERWDE